MVDTFNVLDTVPAAFNIPLARNDDSPTGVKAPRVRQARKNSRKIAARVSGPVPAHDRRAIIVGHGPSLRWTWPAIVKERLATGAAVVSVSGAHDFLMERGIVPDFHVEADPRAHKLAGIKLKNPTTVYQMASIVHPKLINHLKSCKVELWHQWENDGSPGSLPVPGSNERALPVWVEDEEATLIPGGSSTGNRAHVLFYFQGYRTFSTYGMDSSFDADAQHASEHKGKRQVEMIVSCGAREFVTSAAMVQYAREFLQLPRFLPGSDFYVQGDGLLQQMCRVGMANQRPTIRLPT